MKRAPDPLYDALAQVAGSEIRYQRIPRPAGPSLPCVMMLLTEAEAAALLRALKAEGAS